MMACSDGGTMTPVPQDDLLIQKTVDYCHDLISLQDLKEFSLLNVTKFLDSDHKGIANLVREIEGSVVEVEEDLVTEEEFKRHLQAILHGLQQEQTRCAEPSVSQTIQFLLFSSPL